MSDTSTALVAEAERSAGGHVVIAPEKQYRRGGKRGRSSRKAPQLLRDLRWVYENPKREDATPAQMMLQKLLREKPEQFVAQLGELERAHAAGATKPESGDPSFPVDAGDKPAVAAPSASAPGEYANRRDPDWGFA